MVQGTYRVDKEAVEEAFERYFKIKLKCEHVHMCLHVLILS